MKKSLLALLLIIGFMSSAFAKDSLVISQPGDPKNWDPIKTFLVSWGAVASNIYEGLVFRDNKLNLKPALATKWEYKNNNKVLRFTLRKNVKFHDGEKFDAKAVKYTFDRLLGKEGKMGPQYSNYKSIRSIKIVNDYVVDFYLNSYDPVLLTKLSGYGAMIVPPNYDSKKLSAAPVGTGPFKFVTYKQNAYLKLTRFDGYWRGKAKLKNLTFRFITENSTSLAELQSGNIDIMSYVEISDIPVIKSYKKLSLKMIPSPAVYALRFKNANTIFSDIRVRKAVNMAIDKKTIIKTILNSYADDISSFQTSLSFGYDAKLKGYEYNPSKAKKLLKEAGIKHPKITLDFRNNNATFKEVVQAVSAYLQAVGFTVKLKSIETGLFIKSLKDGTTNELYQSSWGGWTFDYDNTAYLLYHTGAPYNPHGTNKEIDNLLDQQRVMINVDKREKVLQQIAENVRDNAFMVPLYGAKNIYGINKRVKGFDAPADNRTYFYNTYIGK